MSHKKAEKLQMNKQKFFIFLITFFIFVTGTMKPATQNQFNIGENLNNTEMRFYTFAEKTSNDKLNQQNPFRININKKEKIILAKIKKKKAIVYFNSHYQIESFWCEYSKDSNNFISDELYVKVNMLIDKFIYYKIMVNDNHNVKFLKILEDISNFIDHKTIFSRLKTINNTFFVWQNSKLSSINNIDNLNVFKAGKKPQNERYKSHMFFSAEYKNNYNDRDQRIDVETKEAKAIEVIMNPNIKATVYFNSHYQIKSFWNRYKEENELISDTLYKKVLTFNTILEKYTADKKLLFQNQYNISFLKILEEISNLRDHDEQYFIGKIDSIIINTTKESENCAKFTDNEINKKNNFSTQENIIPEKENNEKSYWQRIQQAGEFARKNFYTKTAKKLQIGLLFIATFIIYYLLRDQLILKSLGKPQGI